MQCWMLGPPSEESSLLQIEVIDQGHHRRSASRACATQSSKGREEGEIARLGRPSYQFTP